MEMKEYFDIICKLSRVFILAKHLQVNGSTSKAPIHKLQQVNGPIKLQVNGSTSKAPISTNFNRPLWYGSK